MKLGAYHFFRSHTLGCCEAPRKATLYILKRVTFFLTLPFQAFAMASPVAEGEIKVPHVTFQQSREGADPDGEIPGPLPPGWTLVAFRNTHQTTTFWTRFCLIVGRSPEQEVSSFQKRKGNALAL